MSAPNIRSPFGEFLRACFIEYKTTLPDGKISERLWIEKVDEWKAAWDLFRKPKKKAKGGITAPGAEAIYQLYPRKVGKQDALKAILKALNSIPADILSERVRAYAAATARWPKKDKEFIPYPATWFNGGRYDDDPNEWHRVGETYTPVKFTPSTEPTGWLEWMRANRPGWRRFHEEAEGHPVPAWKHLPIVEQTVIMGEMKKTP